MRKISSSMTFFHKRVFPVLWFGFLASFLAIGIIGGGGFRAKDLPFFLIPIGLGAFGYFIMRMFVFDLVDEVYLHDNVLIVRNQGEEDHISVSNIINVDSTLMVNPERITLTLRDPSIFGDEIVFSPPARMWPFSRSPIAKELIQRSRGGDQP